MPLKQDKIFADGFRFEKPREGSPEFVKGRLSIKVPEAIAFLEQYQSNAGWVNIDLKRSQGGKLYLELNTWQPPKKEIPKEQGPVQQHAGVEYPEEDLGDIGF